MSLTTCRCSMSSISWPGRVRAAAETDSRCSVCIFTRTFLAVARRYVIAQHLNIYTTVRVRRHTLVYSIFIMYNNKYLYDARCSVCAGVRLAPRRCMTCSTKRQYCYYYCTKLRVSVFVNRHRRRRRCTATTPRLHKSRGTATAAASMALSPRAPVPPTGRGRWHPGRPIDRLAVQWEGVRYYSLSRHPSPTVAQHPHRHHKP